MAEETAPETVPKARLDAVIADRRAAEQRAEAAEAKVRELEPLRDQVKEHAKAIRGWEAKASGWNDERAIISAGITDPDGVDFARMAWNRIPQEARPEGGLASWLSDPAKLPKAVQAYLPPAPAAASGAQAPAQGTVADIIAGPRGLPSGNAHAVNTTPPAQGKLSAAQLDVAFQQAMSGAMKMEDYNAMAQDVLAGRR